MAGYQELAKNRYRLTSEGRVQVATWRGMVEVVAPYKEEFIRAARELDGRWDKWRRAWIFQPHKREDVLAIVRAIYGGDGAVDVMKPQKKCAGHRFVKVFGGVVCVNCGHFRERRW